VRGMPGGAALAGAALVQAGGAEQGRYGRRSSRGGADRPDDADSRRRGGAGRGEAAARPIKKATTLG
jgi:hypothetical protein